MNKNILPPKSPGATKEEGLKLRGSTKGRKRDRSRETKDFEVIYRHSNPFRPLSLTHIFINPISTNLEL